MEVNKPTKYHSEKTAPGEISTVLFKFTKEQWVPKKPWFKPPMIAIFKWAYSTSFTTYLCERNKTADNIYRLLDISIKFETYDRLFTISATTLDSDRNVISDDYSWPFEYPRFNFIGCVFDLTGKGTRSEDTSLMIRIDCED